MDTQATDTSPRAPSRFRQRPTTRTGRWAARMLGVAFGVYVVASVLTGLFGRRDAGTVDEVMRVLGPVIGVSFGLTGLAALVLSLRAVTREHERSFLVWLALAFGGFVAMFLLGEVLVPH